MEMDFWGSRGHSVKHHAVQSGRLNNFENRLDLVMDATEGDDDSRAWFPCPFCYVEIEVPLLCTHLQEEHCFDLRNAVCPICAANLGKDATVHFTFHHSHSVKRRRKSQKSGLWSNGSFLPREMRSFVSPNRGSRQENAPDPLSAFLGNVPLSEPKGVYQEHQISSDAASSGSDVKSAKSSASDEVKQEDIEERRRRAAFVQQLIFSTVF